MGCHKETIDKVLQMGQSLTRPFNKKLDNFVSQRSGKIILDSSFFITYQKVFTKKKDLQKILQLFQSVHWLYLRKLNGQDFISKRQRADIY